MIWKNMNMQYKSIHEQSWMTNLHPPHHNLWRLPRCRRKCWTKSISRTSPKTANGSPAQKATTKAVRRASTSCTLKGPKRTSSTAWQNWNINRQTKWHRQFDNWPSLHLPQSYPIVSALQFYLHLLFNYSIGILWSHRINIVHHNVYYRIL